LLSFFSEPPSHWLCENTDAERNKMKRMNKLTQQSLVVAVAIAWILGGATMASALPGLQLDLDSLDAYYDNGDETIMTTEDSFSVYAYLTPKHGETGDDLDALLNDTYYVSIALTPKTGPIGGPLGSFTVGGSSVAVTGGMTYGAPPLEGVLTSPWEPGDLQKHGVFETFYHEVAFTFDATQQTTPYDTQVVRHVDGFDDTGSGMYYVELEIDKSLLNTAVQLHFDLYNAELRDCGTSRNPNCDPTDVIVGNEEYSFAPFSHDAETVIPEPTGLMLFAAGLLVVGHTLRRRS